MSPAFGLGRERATQTPANVGTIDSSTPFLAAGEGKLSLLQSSLQTLSLGVNANDENGYTILHAASSYCQLNVLNWILSQNVNVNQVDNDGDSALHYAGNVDAARLLVDAGGADFRIRNIAGKTAQQAKQDDLDELLQDEDADHTEIETLRRTIQYLASL